MKKIVLVFVYCFLFYSISYTQNISPHFSELKGIEDAQGNTNLLYRVQSSRHTLFSIYSDSNCVYNLVPAVQVDTLFLYDGSYCDYMFGYGRSVESYDIWGNDPAKYIYCGTETNCFEGYGFISRYDSMNVRGGIFEFYERIRISHQNDSLVYCSSNILKSTDGGFNWTVVNDTLGFLSLSPFNDQIFFSIGSYYWWGGAYLYKTTDGGLTYLPVDTTNFIDPDFYYDIDGNHIYRTNAFPYPSGTLKVSANEGNAFTWVDIYNTDNPFYISLDASQSGLIYIADGKKIYYSSDYGTTFNFYKELGNKIVGIYKKPNSEIIYAATKYKIYEITPNNITVIKSLSIPDELYKYYPVSIGNYWVYKVYDWSYPNYSENTFTKKVISKEILSNNKEYFKIEEKYYNEPYTYFVYERIDSISGLVYRFDNQCTNPDSEKVIDNLTAELGDSLLIQRYLMCWDSVLTYFSEEGNENIFNEDRSYRKFEYNWLAGFTHKLVNGIGIYSVRYGYDFGETNTVLNGCLLNGILYGDTTLTDIYDEDNPSPTIFSLSQNYPNPFNPSTKIRWQSPVG